MCTSCTMIGVVLSKCLLLYFPEQLIDVCQSQIRTLWVDNCVKTLSALGTHRKLIGHIVVQWYVIPSILSGGLGTRLRLQWKPSFSKNVKELNVQICVNLCKISLTTNVFEIHFVNFSYVSRMSIGMRPTVLFFI